jgi:hypothetical protein
VKAGFTATIYEFDPINGNVICMVAQKGDLYNPIGIFTTNYPELKKKFARDMTKAEADNKDAIKKADEQFSPLKADLASIYKSSISTSAKFLTIPEVLTAAILTDTDIIDVKNTIATNKLQLMEGYTSKYLSSTGTADASGKKFSDNKDYILLDAKTIFDVYSGLSDVSMIYLVFLVAFFGIWGGGKAILSPMAVKMEDKQDNEHKIPYATGIVGGILLFFPTSYDDVAKVSGDSASQYTVYKTQYQEFEKVGYGLFTDWANDAAKVIIDAEMRAIVDKSGVGTKSQIIESATGYQQYNDLANTMTEVKSICRDDIYSYVSLMGGGDSKEMPYSTEGNSAFPTNEKWAYAASIVRSKTLGSYYKTNGDGEVKNSSSYNSNVLKGGGELNDYYPEYSLSACGKAWYQVDNYTNLKDDNKKAYDKVVAASGGNNAAKMNMLSGILKFQYELYRDWGYLAVLGLPVTKMQTEYIGGLYTKNNDVMDKMNDEVSKDSTFGLTHTIMSSIPFMFVPGAGTVFKATMDIANSAKEAVNSTAVGQVGKLFGTGVVASAVGSAAGLTMGYEVAKSSLEISPIIGIVIIGLVRFIVIIIKIFSFHFASLFMMPIMFAKENIQAISKFTMKIFATMLELPIFVLSVWLAITANSLIHTVGDVFSKKIIIGMLENNALAFQGIASWHGTGINGEWLSKLKIYLFDGFTEIAIAIFSIVIIYKLLVSLHNSLFEVLEIQGSRELDGAIESMKNESGGWGAKI